MGMSACTALTARARALWACSMRAACTPRVRLRLPRRAAADRSRMLHAGHTHPVSRHAHRLEDLLHRCGRHARVDGRLLSALRRAAAHAPQPARHRDDRRRGQRHLAAATFSPGTRLSFLRSDGAGAVDMFTDDGVYCRLYVSGKPGSQKVNGMPVEDIFSGIVY